MLADDRVPGDLGMYYAGVPHAFDLLMGNTPGTLGEWLHTIGQPTGWYHLLLAGLLALFGRNQDTFALPGVLWVLLLLVAVARLGRRVGGEGGALAAVALSAAMPGVVLSGRTGWIHVPEAALVLSALAAFAADPELSRRRTALALAGLGGLTLALRPSGLVWVGSLAALLALQALRARRAGAPLPPRALLGVGVGWALGLATLVPALPRYLELKGLARARYEALLPELGLQVQMLLGALPGLLSALGLLGWLILLVRRRADEEGLALGAAERAALGLAAGWLALAGVLWIFFQSGLDNFTLVCPALALLAAASGARLLPRLGPALAVIAFLPSWGLQWVDPPPQGSPLRHIPGLREIPIDPHVLSAFRPLEGFGEAEIRALVDATCGEESPPQRCTVVADQGLFAPFGEEPGYLELFLSGETRVRLFTLRDERLPMSQRVEALSEFHCGDRDLHWRARWPRSLQNLEELMSRAKLEPVWSQQVGPGCTFLWLTPKGYVAHPELLPKSGQRLIAGQPGSHEQLRDAEPPEQELRDLIRPGKPHPTRPREPRAEP